MNDTTLLLSRITDDVREYFYTPRSLQMAPVPQGWKLTFRLTGQIDWKMKNLPVIYIKLGRNPCEVQGPLRNVPPFWLLAGVNFQPCVPPSRLYVQYTVIVFVEVENVSSFADVTIPLPVFHGFKENKCLYFLTTRRSCMQLLYLYLYRNVSLDGGSLVGVLL